MNLSKSYGKKQALSEVSLTLDQRCTALLGPNGAGKTTLIKCVADLIRPSSGSVSSSTGSTRPKVGYLPQSFSFMPNLTVVETLNYLGRLSKINRDDLKSEVDAVIEQTNLGDYVDVQVKALSGGTLRRLGIAQALLGSPELLLLDEPTAGLDIEERAKLKKVLASAKQENPLVISTHLVEDIVDLCERVLIIKEGKLIFDGTIEDIISPTIEEGYLAILHGGAPPSNDREPVAEIEE